MQKQSEKRNVFQSENKAHDYACQSVYDADNQVLIKADFPVHMFEENMSKGQIQIGKEHIEISGGKTVVNDFL